MIYLFLTIFFTDFQKGVSYVSWWHSSYNTQESDSSLTLLKQTNAEWISLLVTWYQDSLPCTTIYRDTLRTPNDEGLIRAINFAHSLGMKVMLKPHVDCQNGAWRGEIEFYNESDWQAWFSSYTQFITYYAELASTYGVEQFCVGCELAKTTHRESNWMAVIDSVRAHFSGEITYAADWSEYDSVGFWDALDYAGIDAYFELTDSLDPPFDSLLGAWVPWVQDIQTFYDTVGKPIIFTEIGYRSVDGANIHPWDWSSTGPVDLQEQADCYEAAFLTFWQKPWWHGVYWWAWETDPNQGGDSCTAYTPHNKPAEDTLKKWYQIIGIEEIDSRVSDYQSIRLEIWPNPFRTKTMIGIQWFSPEANPPLVEAVSEVATAFPDSPRFSTGSLHIYDLAGRLVECFPIADCQLPITRITWAPKELTSGVYFAKFESGKYTATKKLILVR